MRSDAILLQDCVELLITEMEYNKVAIEEKIETEYATVKKSQLDLVRQLDELTENARSTQRTYIYIVYVLEY